MRSKVADDLLQERFERLAAMTPAERVALAGRLGEEGITSFMKTQGVDRRTAIARIKATHRAGRQRSLCGYVDLLDAAALLHSGDRERLALEVEERIDEVHPDVRHLWRQVRTST